jgi:hypothetical protein
MGVTAFLLAFLFGLIASAQEAAPPVVIEHTDGPIQANDPRSIQAHAEIQTLRWTLNLRGGKVLGTSTMVVRKFADGWKFISDHSTTLEP